MTDWLPVVESAHLPPRRPITPPAGWRGYLTPRWLRFRYERFLERIGAERLWQHTPTIEPERVYVVRGLGVFASPEAAAAMRVVGADFGAEPDRSLWVLQPWPLNVPALAFAAEPPPIADWSTRTRLSLNTPFIPFRNSAAIIRGDIS